MDWRKKVHDNYISSQINTIVENLIESVDKKQDYFANNVIQKGGSAKPEKTTFQWEEISRTKKKTFQKLRRNCEEIKFYIKHNLGSFDDLFDVEKNIDDFYDTFMSEKIKNLSENDLISVDISHSELHGKPLFIPPTFKKNFNKQGLFNALFEICQSNRSFLLNGILDLKLNITNELKGSGKIKGPETIDEIKTKSKCVIKINNNNFACGWHAIAVCKGKHELEANSYEWQCMRRNTNGYQRIEAIKLANFVNLDYNKEITINDFGQIQSVLKKYQIVVIDANNKRNRLFYGANYSIKKIYIELEADEINGSHYNAIINIIPYMGQKYYCEHCHTPYSHLFTHSCIYICENCLCFPKCATNNNITINCNNCNLNFMTTQCYNNHLAIKNLCKKRKKCKKCEIVFIDKHECDLKKCGVCGENYKLEHHYCFLKTLDINKLNKEDNCKKIIISYDLECQQNITEDSSIIHVPDLVISMTTCKDCWDCETSKRNLNNCEICGNYKNIFFGKHCIRQFGDYLYQLGKIAAKKQCNIYAYAHNAKGYDNHFILNDLFQRKFANISVIMNGNKVLKASIANIKFLDSLLMFQQPLANLPKAFGFENIVTKGFFPHNFHTSNNINYIGKIPKQEFFGTKYMKTKQLSEFKKWYIQEENKHLNNNEKYNLKNELIKYCENDVLILLNCIQVFRKIYMSVTGIDPITRCFTLASMGLEIFKAKILTPKTIGVTPIDGYNKTGSFSKIGNCWLDYQEKILNCKIEREIPLDNYVADGYNKKFNTIFEYQGCYYHCHHCVYPDKRDEKIIRSDGKHLNKTPNEIYNNTLVKKNHLTLKRGFNFVEEWDCTLVKKRKLNKNLDSYFKLRYDYYTLLEQYGGVNVRESFFGGRTNNIKFYCDVSENVDSKILYFDFRSLYPTVLKYKKFPVGHPLVINENFKYNKISEYFGFIKCIINPPTNLRIPVLPLKINNKLLFPLCYTCAKEKIQINCKHSQLERRLIGTWTTIEIENAISHGYQIDKIIEIYHYEKTTKDIFSEYINLWLKFKQQSDGWPSWINTDEDKKSYIENFFNNENVLLEEKSIEKNPALRFIAKLFLNTLWGKLAQRPNLPQTKVCNEYFEYWELATDPTKVIKGELMVNEDCLLVTWEHVDNNMGKVGNTSVAIASFVTSYARTELMKVIDEVEKVTNRLLYMDTDSIIFKYTEGEPLPKTDDYLGCLADEITKDYGNNAICTKFCSLGPKVYAMEIWPENAIQPIVPIKAKGITLTHTALNIIKMESMVTLANNYIKNKGGANDDVLKIPQMNIYSDKMHTVKTRYFNKTFRVMSEKRRIDGNDTLPYGYIK